MRRRLALWLCPALRSELEDLETSYLGACRAAERQRAMAEAQRDVARRWREMFNEACALARMSPEERAEWSETWRDIQRGRVPR